MLSSLAAILLLISMGSIGVAALRRAVDDLEPLEYVAYGVPFGAVVASLATLPLATFFGLSTPLVVMLGLVSAVGSVLLWPDRLPLSMARDAIATPSRLLNSCARESFIRTIRSHVSLLPILVIGAFLLRWVLLFGSAVYYQEDGLWAGHIWVWGDWALHMGDVASFAYGDNFPPMEPRLVGQPFSYHFLVSLTTALLVKLGMDPASALNLHSFVFSAMILLGLYAFARRLTGDQSVACLALVLFLLGGGLGWVLLIGDIDRSHDLIGTLRDIRFGEREAAINITWLNAVFAFILAQRPYLYGLPLGLLVLTLLFRAVREDRPRLFEVAGMVAGVLPFAHLGTLLALALITPFLFLLFPRLAWARFFLVWTVIAVPQLIVQQAGSSGAAAALRMQVGWIAPPDPWIWYWLKNLGLFVPLLLLALAARDLVPRPAKRFLLAFMPVFIIANLVVFQPWAWDNTKVLFYWFIGVSILVAALIVRTWRAHHDPLVRFFVSVAVVTMLLSGLLANLQQLLGKNQHRLLTSEELRVAELVRTETSPRSVFLIGLQHNHPISMLTGRPVVMGFPGWIWTHGQNYGSRESDVRAIYVFSQQTPELLKRYDVDYVAIGPFERDQLKANVDAFRARYPRVISTGQYEIFDVRGPQ